MKQLIQLANLALNIINYLNLETVMANIKQLQSQIVDLQASVDNEQAQVAALLEAQKSAIADLQVAVDKLSQLAADGGTEEERQALSDSIAAVKADLESTVEDVEASTTTTTTAAEESTTSSTTESTTETTTEAPVEEGV